MTDSIPTQGRPIPDDVAEKIQAVMSSTHEVVDLLGQHFGMCPASTVDEDTVLRWIDRRLNGARLPVTLEDATVEAVALLNDDLRDLERLRDAHILICPDAAKPS